jgi:hypothetical protein
MPNGSATWRSIRGDLESLPPADWSFIWTSRPPVAVFIPIQLQSQWTWLHPADPSLRARATAIFVKAAKARGYNTEDEWLDELRFADFVKFRLSSESTDKLADGTIVKTDGGILTDAVGHSITLCHRLEAGIAPKPIIRRLPTEAGLRLDATIAAFMVDFVEKRKCELQRVESERERGVRAAKLLREWVIHHFNVAAREYLEACTSEGDFETELRAGLARFVQVTVGQHDWLGDAMQAELNAGFALFVMGAKPAGIGEAERESKRHLGAMIAEALSNTSLKLIEEAKARRVEALPDTNGATEPKPTDSSGEDAGLAVKSAKPFSTIEAAIKLFESHPDFPRVQVRMRERLEEAAHHLSADASAFGSKARLQYVLSLFDIRAGAFWELVSDMPTQNAFILVLGSSERAAWEEYTGWPIEVARPASAESEADMTAIHARVRHWTTEGYKRLAQSNAEGTTPGAAETSTDHPSPSKSAPIESGPQAVRKNRLVPSVDSPLAARRMEAYIQSHDGPSKFAVQANTTERTIRNFRKTGRVRRDIFKNIADAMDTTPEELLKPE